MMMEFGTPKQWMMSRKNSTACLDLIVDIGRASIHFVNLSTVTSRWVKPPGAFLSGPTRSSPPDHEGPHDGDHLECLGQEVSLPSIVLTPFAGAYDLLSVSYCSGPVEALSECVSNQGPQRDVVTADPTMDVAQQKSSLFTGDAELQDPGMAPSVEFALYKDEGLDAMCEPLSLRLVRW